MKRKLLILPAIALLFGLSACQESSSYQMYKRYLATLEGNDPIFYDDWLEHMKGQDGKDAEAPTFEIGENGHFYVNGEDTGVTAKGETGDKGLQGEQGEKGDKGDKGETGENAVTPYELYKSLHPDYVKNEDEFYSDLANGSAGNQVFHTVSFTYNGEELSEPQTILHGEKATRPNTPAVAGLTFVNWTYEYEAWNFNASVTTDLVLVAVFE